MASKKSRKPTLKRKKLLNLSSQSLSDLQLKNVFKELKPLIEGLRQPSVATFKLAHNYISKLILENTSKKGLTDIENIIFLLSVRLSLANLRGFATLDSELISQINSFVETIEMYIKDASQQRPLNFMMLASPGAGKSHFIKCVASHLSAQNVCAITFNMASMQSNDDLIPSIDAARNLKVQDRLPLIFLDEFDSSPNNYALLLPLLWDGGLNLGQRDLRLGKVIIVMAGSDPKLPETMEYARSMREGDPPTIGHNPKLIDLFSRVNGGVIKISPFFDLSKNTDRRADKVCIAIELLRQRFGKNLKRVPLGLIRFIAEVDFRYDVRSIAHLIDLIPYRKNLSELSLRQLSLPLRSAAQLKQSSLIYHLLHEDQALGMIKKWKDSFFTNTSLNIDSDATNKIERLLFIPKEFYDRYLQKIIHEF